MKLTFRVPPQPNDVFHPSAAESLKGKDATFLGKQVKVIDAYVDEGDLIITLELPDINN